MKNNQLFNFLWKNKKYQKQSKEKKRLLKDSNSSNSFVKNNKNSIIKIIWLFFIFTIVILIIFIVVLFKKLKEISYQKYIYESFRSNQDINLFLKNKTEFYYRERKHAFKYYDETKLLTFQDKINYLSIHESPEYKANLADKIKLGEYSKKILGKNICVPIIKVYNDADEINLDELPDKFVLKCNHGSGMNIFCKNKSEFDLEISKKQLNDWLNFNYGLGGAEFQYYFIKRKIFSSLYLGDGIIDYKVYCFNGNPKYIVAKKLLNEKTHQYAYNYYNLDWTLSEIEYGSNQYKRDPNVLIEKPKNLDLIIDYAKKLSNEFGFVRVDFFEIDNTVYLGELTFTPTNAINSFKDEEQRKYLGSLIDIKKIKPSLFNK